MPNHFHFLIKVKDNPNTQDVIKTSEVLETSEVFSFLTQIMLLSICFPHRRRHRQRVLQDYQAHYYQLRKMSI